MLCIVKQIVSVENLSVIEHNGINHLIQGFLCLCSIKSRHSGDDSDVIIDKCLSAHGKLLTVSLKLACRKLLCLNSAMLKLTGLRNLFKFSQSINYILMVGVFLKVGLRADSYPLTKGSRNFLVGFYYSLLCYRIKDCRECCCGIEILSAKLCVNLIRTHKTYRLVCTISCTR